MALFLSSCGSNTNENGEETAAPLNQEEAIKDAGIVTVYSHRHYDVDKKIFADFEEKTGIKVMVKEDKASKLIELIAQKGDDADVLITVDVARLEQAREKGILQPIESDVITSRVPDKFRGSENHWIGLTKRYRVLAYSKERVDPEELTTYEGLTNEKWMGKIAVRSSDNTYNQSLMASIIANSNQDEAAKWAKGVVSNFCRSPKGNDRDQVKEVAAGRADIAIINTYYLGKLLNSENQAEVDAGNAVGLVFPNYEDRGAHVNISGAGVCTNAPNKENAIKLIEYLLSDEVQAMYSAANYEYPIVEGVESSELLQSWGTFKEDDLPLEEIGKLNSTAIAVFAASGWE